MFLRCVIYLVFVFCLFLRKWTKKNRNTNVSEVIPENFIEKKY